MLRQRLKGTILYRYGRPFELNSWYQFSQLFAGPGTGATGIRAISITYLVTLPSAVIRHLGACLAEVAVQRGIVLHEVRSCQAHLRAILQHLNVLAMASCLLIVFSCLQANIVAGQAVLNALLHLYLAHLVPCVLCHASSFFRV